MLQSCNKVFPKFVKISRYLGGKVLEWNSFLKFNKKKERKKDKFPFRIREISYETTNLRKNLLRYKNCSNESLFIIRLADQPNFNQLSTQFYEISRDINRG